MYRLMFTGDLVTGFQRREVIDKLASLLGQSPDEVRESLFTGEPVEFKTVENKDDANQWRRDFADAGQRREAPGDRPPLAAIATGARGRREPAVVVVARDVSRPVEALDLVVGRGARGSGALLLGRAAAAHEPAPGASGRLRDPGRSGKVARRRTAGGGEGTG